MTSREPLSERDYMSAMLERQRPLLGDEGMERLDRAVVAHAGLGGGGALTLEILARAGIRRFRLLDRDRYEPSNLNRQAFATSETVGKPKVEVAAARLRQINPYVQIEASFFEAASRRNVEALLKDADLGMVCTDSPSSHVFFSQVARQARTRLIFGAAPGFGCAVWVEAHDLPGGADGRFGRLKSSLRRLRGEWDLYALSEEETLALDRREDGAGGFTPTISYAPNCSACLASALAIHFLSGIDMRPHSIRMDFRRFSQVNPMSHLVSSLKGLLLS
ncbi:hypothetical protein GF377_00300 [candidate division GN15 bacterium]|nr:hypothetical protein [candidate division GN15 bacterium]